MSGWLGANPINTPPSASQVSLEPPSVVPTSPTEEYIKLSIGQTASNNGTEEIAQRLGSQRDRGDAAIGKERAQKDNGSYLRLVNLTGSEKWANDRTGRQTDRKWGV